jgi:hypothetical protein
VSHPLLWFLSACHGDCARAQRPPPEVTTVPKVEEEIDPNEDIPEDKEQEWKDRATRYAKELVMETFLKRRREAPALLMGAPGVRVSLASRVSY